MSTNDPSLALPNIEELRGLHRAVVAAPHTPEGRHYLQAYLTQSLVLALSPNPVARDRAGDALHQSTSRRSDPSSPSAWANADRDTVEILHMMISAEEMIPVFSHPGAMPFALNLNPHWLVHYVAMVPGGSVLAVTGPLTVVFNPWSPAEYQLQVAPPDPRPPEHVWGSASP